MRGTPAESTIIIIRPGIIPAHAGNTAERVPWRLGARDHPRACGEHNMFSQPIPYEKGSSPRMRGTLFDVPCVFVNVGIIPAHAGNTLHKILGGEFVGDHPRACGEHVTIPEDALLTAGSSPRMRGTLSVKFFYFRRVGIIPAHAGNTPFGRVRPMPTRDHPRACGEHC